MSAQTSTMSARTSTMSAKTSPTVAAKTSTKVPPKDSMKSEWYTAPDRSQWTFFHYLYLIFDLYPVDPTKTIPVHAKTDTVPHFSLWSTHLWVSVHAAIPLLLHHFYIQYTGRNMGPVAAFAFYSVAIKLTALREIRFLRRIGEKTGFLDGDRHLRDGVPDTKVRSIFTSLISTATFRPMLCSMMAYRTSLGPSSINWPMLAVELCLYGVIVDFWFYWYHRVMHEVDFLWKFHRTHHLTKHPNPLLSLYADFEQEVFDIAVIPLASYLTMRAVGLPMGFYEWFICQQFVIFTELLGHSGLRMWGPAISPAAFFMRLTGTELIIEDHDLHHRQGWKTSGNYGKHTRVWDTLFGTCLDRIESGKDNVEWDKPVYMPFF